MKLAFSRKLVVNLLGVILLVAVGVGLYIRVARPRIKQWGELKGEIQQREKRLKALRTAFANQQNPQDELKTLAVEIENLKQASKNLEKVKTAGVETSDLPKELNDPDPEIKKELYRDYMAEVMEVTEASLKGKLMDAKIPPPEFTLYNELASAEEAAYYMNRAAGLQGIIQAMEQTRAEGNSLVFNELKLEHYKQGSKRRKGAVNIMSYSLDVKMDTKTLLSFLYHLQNQDNYYFLEDLKLEPSGSRIGMGAPGLKSSGGQALKVTTRINTTMIFKSAAKKQVKVAAAKAAVAKPDVVTKKAAGPTDWISAIAAAAAEEQKKEAEGGSEGKKKKWYEFWKWFRK